MGYALVAMSNKDTYFVSIEQGREVQKAMTAPKPPAFVRLYDIKNKTTVVVNPRFVSSIVVRGGEL